jgi:hypothetical protein
LLFYHDCQNAEEKREKRRNERGRDGGRERDREAEREVSSGSLTIPVPYSAGKTIVSGKNLIDSGLGVVSVLIKKDLLVIEAPFHLGRRARRHNTAEAIDDATQRRENLTSSPSACMCVVVSAGHGLESLSLLSVCRDSNSDKDKPGRVFIYQMV